MSLVRSREMCLAQFADENAARAGSRTWVRADPFQPAMKRFSIGRVGSGKTVGAMAAASRVLGAYPDARVLVFTPFPNSYEEIGDVLRAKTGPQTDAPSAVRVRPADMPHWSESVGELPAVSITDPHKRGEYETVARALTRCSEQLSKHSGAALTPGTGSKGPSPVYLIMDEADKLFRSSVDLDLRRFFRPASTSDRRVAIHALTQDASASQFRSVTEQFSAIDLYPVAEPKTIQWLFGLSADDMAFIREAERPSRVKAGDVEMSESEVLREAAPTGLCYTAEDGWQRVRYPLFTIEATAMLDSEASRETAVELEVTS